MRLPVARASARTMLAPRHLELKDTLSAATRSMSQNLKDICSAATRSLSDANTEGVEAPPDHRSPVRWRPTHQPPCRQKSDGMAVTQNDKDGAGPDTVTATRGGCPTISPTVCALNNKCGHATLRQAEPKPTPTATPTRRWRPCRLPATDTGPLTYVIMVHPDTSHVTSTPAPTPTLTPTSLNINTMTSDPTPPS
eukprot:COSAG01_NODE_11756_length_1864_cov_14.369972_1_plen_195_part_00